MNLFDGRHLPAGMPAGVTAAPGGIVFDSFLLFVIAGCEIAFWVFLVAGLFARYALRLRRLGGVLLVCVPLVDLVLVVVSLLDLLRGGAPGLTHSLAAVYLGVSVAFGPEIVRRTDAWFAHWFGAGPRPRRPEGRQRVRHEWRMWGRFVAATAISAVVAAAMSLAAGAEADTDVLWNIPSRMVLATVIWLVGWPLRLTVLSPAEPEQDERRAGRARSGV